MSWANAEHAASTTATKTSISITTKPHTDLWQRTFYGFRCSNAPHYVWTKEENFTFSAEALYTYQGRFDQCGVIVWIDDATWMKTSVEFETNGLSRLGSVVTNAGYSDWATTDVPTTSRMFYRVSRRGPDFLIETSTDGQEFRQMRVFHFHGMGTTSRESAQMQNPPAEAPVRVGVYACSPTDSSFQATFQNISMGPSTWKPHA